MSEFTKVIKTDDSISVVFYIENDRVMTIGEKMEELNPEAYMNGYNWEAVLNYYLEKNASELTEGLETDPEAGMYAAYYELSDENEEKAEKLVRIIEHLIENAGELYELVSEHGDEIEWD